MNQIDPAGHPPQSEQVWQKARHSPQPPDTLNPGGGVGSIDLNEFNFRTLGREQLSKLPGLIRHPTGGRRQGSNQPDRERVEIHPLRPFTRRSYTGR